jgi:hypothetical protein
MRYDGDDVIREVAAIGWLPVGLVLLTAVGACIADATLIPLPGGGGGDGGTAMGGGGTTSAGGGSSTVSAGGSGGSTASTGGGSTTGTGGMAMCAEPTDCFGTDTTCEYRTCEGGFCGFGVAAIGTPCSENAGTVCDGAGKCVECVQNADCNAAPCIMNLCGGLKPLGEACSFDAQCLSGHCPTDDGVCCDQPCAGSCESCLAADTCGTTGTCADVVPATDPDGECNAGATCFNGSCMQGRVVFVTSTAYNGNLGGLSGADAICQNHAAMACLPGTYLPWLSTGAASPSTRFTQSSIPYRRVDGIPIAVNYNNLVDGSIDAPINLDQHGNVPPAANFECGPGIITMVWSGTNTSGNAQGTSAGRCSEWTSPSSGGHWGRRDLSNGNWTHWCRGEVAGTCGYTAPLYCFQQ